ncbi:hypothetical protein [Dickeya undicola]|uniref:Uncharacterized protein n=1 Tax=Dickeya undicola TaxID=1577887 RepID=A0A3N0G135_9GAMM|nr:hypothetical protein [Dickeya undicola]RNM05941.1 hypothetical protein EF878_11970 [Dickeya undicola]
MRMAQYKENLLNEFEARTDEWSYADFERRLTELKRGTNYQHAKSIINDAFKSGKWPMTVKRYLLTNYKSFGNVSAEFTTTFNQIYSSMSDSEKESWGIQ